jgi:ribosomal protein L40E
MKLISKYLKEEKVCFHCKSAQPEKGSNLCGKCRKELEAWRNKKNKNTGNDE